MPAGIGLHPFFVRDADTQLTCRTQAVWRTDAEVLPVERIAVPADWDFSRRPARSIASRSTIASTAGTAVPTIVWPQHRPAARPRGDGAVPPSRDLRPARPIVLLRRAGEPRQRAGGSGAARTGRHRWPARSSFVSPTCEGSMPEFASYPSLKGRSRVRLGRRLGHRRLDRRALRRARRQGRLRRHQRAGLEGDRRQDRRAVPEMRHPRREGLPGGARRGRGQARHHHRAGQQRRARRAAQARGRDARVLGRPHRRQPASRLLRHPGGGARHEAGGRRLDRELQLGELSHHDRQPLRLSGGEGGDDRHDARPGARSRRRTRSGSMRSRRAGS